MEKNVLVVSDDQEFVDFIALIMEGEYQFNLQEIDEYEVAKKMISKNSQRYLAIINTVHTENVLENILYKENLANQKIPFIQILDVEYIDPSEFQEFFNQNQYNFVLPKQNIHKDIMIVCEKIQKRFDIDADDKNVYKTKDGTELFPIKINRYLRAEKAVSDIFIRIGAGKFIKLIRAGEIIDREKIIDYSKKVKNSYIKLKKIMKWLFNQPLIKFYLNLKVKT